MSRAIAQIQISGGTALTVGHFGLGTHGQGIGSIQQQIQDGDTIGVRALGDFRVRFLGVDAPEISFRHPVTKSIVSLKDPGWEAYLSDPFAGTEGAAFRQSLRPSLVIHLQGILGPGVASNQTKHAETAQKALEGQVEADLIELGQTKENFELFLAFASEVTDRYGSILAYVNRKQETGTRPLDYNSRLLKAGRISPYFIWPNINPFRRQKSFQDAVPAAGTAGVLSQQDVALRDARTWVEAARQNRIGLFEELDPLRLQPFEIRYLAQRLPPFRWVIDLGKSNDQLLHPQLYHTVPKVEDRLFIPPEYVPLFLEKGWKRVP